MTKLRFFCLVVLFSFLLSASFCCAQQIPQAYSFTNNKIRIGLVHYTLPAVNAPILETTLATIKKHITDCEIEEIHLPREELEKAVINGSVDVFLSSAGFYRRLVPYGARDLATAISSAFPDPNHSEGTAIIVRNEDTALRTLNDLKGKRLVITNLHGFSGFQIPMGEIIERGGSRDSFFSSILEVGDAGNAQLVLERLKDKQADVAFAKQCLLEHYLAEHPQDIRSFRVIEPKHSIGQCARSTSLYPTWTLASTPSATPEMSRRVTSVVLNMPPSADGLCWGVATDYSAVDKILKNLQIGPYEHLRHWTLRAFLERFWPLICSIVLLIIGLVVHNHRVGELVKRRTIDLQNALVQQEMLRKEASDAQERLTNMQKIGMINQISSIVAHELRQPLGTIALYVAGLRTLLKQGNFEVKTVEQVINQLERQTQRADEIVQKVRSFRKNSSGISAMVNISNVVKSAVDNFMLSRTGAPLSVTIAIEPEVFIRGDTLEIELLVVNLVKNATEAIGMQEDGFVHVTLIGTSNSVQLTVTDNGPIHSQKEADAVRNRMNTTKENGLGLGLQIVWGIVERHQANLTFTARRPCGLIVTVDFPLPKND